MATEVPPGMVFWGSDCNACEGNSTHRSMVCDLCGSDKGTVALFHKDYSAKDRRVAPYLTFAQVSVVNRQRCERWHPGFPHGAPMTESDDWTGADWSNAMCGEAGEVANVVKKLRRAEVGLRGVLDGDRADLLTKLADEIADVYCYLDLLATFYGIDVPAAIVTKFNAVSELQGFPERLP